MPESEDEDENLYHDLGVNVEIGMDDLAIDEEEFPFGTDPEQFIAMTQEVIDELSKVCQANVVNHTKLIL